MTEKQLQEHLTNHFPIENEKWERFKVRHTEYGS